jgi:hypothetical protein
MSKKNGRKGKVYSGRFQRGYDPRRHVFTREERSRGYWSALMSGQDWLASYVYRVVRDYYRARGKRQQKGRWDSGLDIPL